MHYCIGLPSSLISIFKKPFDVIVQIKLQQKNSDLKEPVEFSITTICILLNYMVNLHLNE